jgi:hypothetical protein
MESVSRAPGDVMSPCLEGSSMATKDHSVLEPTTDNLACSSASSGPSVPISSTPDDI